MPLQNEIVTLGYGINTINRNSAKQAIPVALETTKQPAAAANQNKTQDQVVVTVALPQSMINKGNTEQDSKTPAPESTSTPPQESKDNVESVVTIKNGAPVTPVKNAAPEATMKSASTPADNLTSEFKVFTSLLDLKKSFSGSLNASITQGQYSFSGELDFSRIHQQSVNDLYCVLHLHSSTETISINGEYKLNTSAEDMLKNNNLPEFVKNYGDGFVNSITYGRFAIVVIQFHLSSNQEQRALAASLQGAVGQSISSGGKFSNTFESALTNKECTIYQHVSGIDYVATPIPNDESGISAIIAKFSTLQQTAKPVQIGWTFKPYHLAASPANRQNAINLERIVSVARNLSDMVNRCRMAIKDDLQALYADNNWPKENWHLREPSKREDLILKLRSIDSILATLTENIANNLCDENALQNYAGQIKKLNAEIKKIGLSFPSTDELPVIQIPSDQVQKIKHKEGQYEFDINPPESVKTLKFYIKDLSAQEQLTAKAIVHSAQEIVKATRKIITVAEECLNGDNTGEQYAEIAFNMKIAVAHAEQVKRAYKLLKRLNKDWEDFQKVSKKKKATEIENNISRQNAVIEKIKANLKNTVAAVKIAKTINNFVILHTKPLTSKTENDQELENMKKDLKIELSKHQRPIKLAWARLLKNTKDIGAEIDKLINDSNEALKNTDDIFKQKGILGKLLLGLQNYFEFSDFDVYQKKINDAADENSLVQLRDEIVQASGNHFNKFFDVIKEILQLIADEVLDMSEFQQSPQNNISKNKNIELTFQNKKIADSCLEKLTEIGVENKKLEIIKPDMEHTQTEYIIELTPEEYTAYQKSQLSVLQLSVLNIPLVTTKMLEKIDVKINEVKTLLASQTETSESIDALSKAVREQNMSLDIKSLDDKNDCKPKIKLKQHAYGYRSRANVRRFFEPTYTDKRSIQNGIEDGSELAVGTATSNVYLKPARNWFSHAFWYTPNQLPVPETLEKYPKYQVGVFARCDLDRPKVNLPEDTEIDKAVTSLNVIKPQ